MVGHGGQNGRAGDGDFSRAKRLLEGLGRPAPAGPPEQAASGGDMLKSLVDALKAAPGKISPIEPPGYGHLLAVRHGDPLGPDGRGEAIEALQAALRRVGLEVPSTGRYDQATEAAVRRLQRRSQVEETGVFGPETLAALHAELGLPALDGEEPPVEETPRSGSGAGVLPPSGNAFVDLVAPGAVRGMHESGVPASALLAMAVVESDWGTSLLCRSANNVFGLQGAGPAGSVIMREAGGTLEPAGSGTAYRRYDDPAQAVADFARAFAASSAYEGVMTHRDRPEDFARALSGSYSSSPNYGALVLRIMRQLDLGRFDAVPPPGGQDD